MYDSVGLVIDIGEFQTFGHEDVAWTPENRVHGVAEWLADRRSWATCELYAMDSSYEGLDRIKFELCGYGVRKGVDPRYSVKPQ